MDIYITEIKFHEITLLYYILPNLTLSIMFFFFNVGLNLLNRFHYPLT